MIILDEINQILMGMELGQPQKDKSYELKPKGNLKCT